MSRRQARPDGSALAVPRREHRPPAGGSDSDSDGTDPDEPTAHLIGERRAAPLSAGPLAAGPAAVALDRSGARSAKPPAVVGLGTLFTAAAVAAAGSRGKPAAGKAPEQRAAGGAAPASGGGGLVQRNVPLSALQVRRAEPADGTARSWGAGQTVGGKARPAPVMPPIPPPIAEPNRRRPPTAAAHKPSLRAPQLALTKPSSRQSALPTAGGYSSGTPSSLASSPAGWRDAGQLWSPPPARRSGLKKNGLQLASSPLSSRASAAASFDPAATDYR